MSQVMLQALLRHALNALGAYLVTQGLVDENAWGEAAAGLAAVGASVGWSLWEKRNPTIRTMELRPPE